jgi:hypothetical protein
MVHHLTFCRLVRVREFPDRWIGREGRIPWSPRSPELTPLDILFWGIVKDTVYHDKVQNNVNYMTESSELQSALPMKCLPLPNEKLNIVLTCVVPLVVAVLKSTKYIGNFVKSSVPKCVDFFSTLYRCFIAI